MAKSSKRPLRYDKEVGGCIWGLISIFDFRHGRSTRKLISDRGRANRQPVGVGFSRSQLLLGNSDKKFQGVNDDVESETLRGDEAGAGMASVKELMEEEMADTESKESTSEAGGERAKKRHVRARKKSWDDGESTAKSSELKNSCHQLSDQINLDRFDLEVLIEELCHQIHQKSTTSVKHGTCSSASEESLISALKVFLDHKFQHPEEDGKIHQPEEFIDALQMLSSNREFFFKLLRDPNSALVKMIQDLAKDTKSVARSNFFDEEVNNSSGFFRRKSKSKEKTPVKENENYRPTSRIVVLKPGPAAVRSSDNEMDSGLSLQSRPNMGKNEGHSEKIVSQFSFTEIKRKLKHAMGKDHHRVLSVSNVDSGGWSSPNRDHFYTEKFARPPNVVKSKEILSDQRVSNIYIEAKKHLSDMLSNGNEFEGFSSKGSPKTLGRILAVPEYNFSPLCSPGKGKEQEFVSTRFRTSPRNSFRLGDDIIIQETRLSTDEELKARNSDACKDVMMETLSPTKESCSKDHVELGETTGIVEGEKSRPSITVDGEYADNDESCDVEKSSECLKLDSLEEDETVSSPLTSPKSSIIKKGDDTETTNERTPHPSPDSVLEPLFAEDDFKPASIKFQSGEKISLLQPNRLEERKYSPEENEVCLRISMEDQESIFEYVEAVLLGSGLNWEEFILRWLCAEELLEASLFDEVELFSTRSCQEQKLLFDCTNEVLKEVFERYFCYSPCVRKNIRPIPRAENLISEVWEGVEWHLLVQPPPRTLEQTMKKDLEKDPTWMDLRFEVEGTGFEISKLIFEELLQDIVVSFTNQGPQCEFDLHIA